MTSKQKQGDVVDFSADFKATTYTNFVSELMDQHRLVRVRQSELNEAGWADKPEGDSSIVQVSTWYATVARECNHRAAAHLSAGDFADAMRFINLSQTLAGDCQTFLQQSAVQASSTSSRVKHIRQVIVEVDNVKRSSLQLILLLERRRWRDDASHHTAIADALKAQYQTSEHRNRVSEIAAAVESPRFGRRGSLRRMSADDAADIMQLKTPLLWKPRPPPGLMTPAAPELSLADLRTEVKRFVPRPPAGSTNSAAVVPVSAKASTGETQTNRVDMMASSEHALSRAAASIARNTPRLKTSKPEEVRPPPASLLVQSVREPEMVTGEPAMQRTKAQVTPIPHHLYADWIRQRRPHRAATDDREDPPLLTREVGPDPPVLDLSRLRELQKNDDVPSMADAGLAPQQSHSILAFLAGHPQGRHLESDCLSGATLPRHLTLNAVLATHRLQRWWRQRQAHFERKFRTDLRDLYLNVVIRKIDALCIVVPALRVNVARRRFLRLQQTKDHVIAQRVELEAAAPLRKVSGEGGDDSDPDDGGASSRPSSGKMKSALLMAATRAVYSQHNLKLHRFLQQISSQRLQRWWRRMLRREFDVSVDDTLRLLCFVTCKTRTPFSKMSEVRSTSPVVPREEGQGGSAGDEILFAPLKAVKLSQLEALRRQQEIEEERKRRELEELFQQERLRRRRDLRRRTEAARLVQRVCRAYRRRLFLYASLITNTGNRFAFSANPFLRHIRHRHDAGPVGVRVETDIMNMIGRRRPHLIPKFRAEQQRKRAIQATTVQTACRSAYSRLVVRALRRRYAAIRIQRFWMRARRMTPT